MNAILFHPLFAAGALQFAFERATTEGKVTIGALVILSFFSWTVIITKTRQLYLASKLTRKFMAAFDAAGSPLELPRLDARFDGIPAFQVYRRAATEVERLLKIAPAAHDPGRMSTPAFEAVKAALEESVGAQAIGLERGMIVLSTAVAGGPFLGLLGTVWGVMETFAGIAHANAATLTAMAPGVAGALIATVVGLLVAIPAMFAYNFMVTTIRNLTQELDAFATRYAAQVSLMYVERSTAA
jgi:biopolymer transport protein ExbB/TolQ